MRTLIAASLFACSGFARAQITLEHEYPGSIELFTVTLADGSIKYRQDIYAGPDIEIKLYNLDHTPFRTIQLDISDYCPTGSAGSGYFERPRYITDHLFDMDGGIEVFTVTQCFDSTTWMTNQRALVLDENGDVIFSRDSLASMGDSELPDGGYGTILNTPGGTKMLLQSLTVNHSAMVYSLPGMFPAQIDIVSGGNPEMETYPNPVKSAFTVNYDTHGIPFGTLSIRDLNGHEVASQPFSGDTGSMSVDVSSLASGTYLVAIVANGNIIGSRKIVVAQ